jgi:hypothetical protein
MERKTSMALPTFLALGAIGLMGSSAAGQNVGGGVVYAPGPVYYSPSYHAPPPLAAGGYGYVVPAPTFRHPVLVPIRPSGRIYHAYPRPSPSHGLEAESLPAQIAEDLAPARAVPPRSGWRRGWSWWRFPRNR